MLHLVCEVAGGECVWCVVTVSVILLLGGSRVCLADVNTLMVSVICVYLVLVIS